LQRARESELDITTTAIRKVTMTAIVLGVSVPTGANVDIHICVTAQMNITAYVAQQKVNVFAMMEISTQCRATTPELRVGESLCWSVPVEFTSPSRGSLGIVGEILVDVETGAVLADADTVQRITDNARLLAERVVACVS
jgi:hypothetical protein